MREKTYLNLKNCDKEVLESLPPNIRVDGILLVWENKNLTSLPEKLKVGKGLSLSGCEFLKSLPQGLKIGGYLNLHGCTSLTSLPEDLQVGGDIYCNYKTGFVRIDGWKDDPKIIPVHLKDKLVRD